MYLLAVQKIQDSSETKTNIRNLYKKLLKVKQENSEK